MTYAILAENFWKFKPRRPQPSRTSSLFLVFWIIFSWKIAAFETLERWRHMVTTLDQQNKPKRKADNIHPTKTHGWNKTRFFYHFFQRKSLVSTFTASLHLRTDLGFFFFFFMKRPNKHMTWKWRTTPTSASYVNEMAWKRNHPPLYVRCLKYESVKK